MHAYRYNNLDELYHSKSEEGLSRLLAFLREEEERERLEQIERMKPIGTQVPSPLLDLLLLLLERQAKPIQGSPCPSVAMLKADIAFDWHGRRELQVNISRQQWCCVHGDLQSQLLFGARTEGTNLRQLLCALRLWPSAGGQLHGVQVQSRQRPERDTG